MDGNVRINPYLAGNFAPVRSEDDFDLKVTGEIPAGLRGALFRIGPKPAVRAPAIPSNHHWFGGDVHGPRLLRRGWQGPLPQPLRPHPQVGAGARARPRPWFEARWAIR